MLQYLALLDAGASGSSDATAMIIAGLGAAVSAMATVLTGLVLSKFSGLTKDLKDATNKLHELALTIEKLNAFALWATSEINALKDKGLTREIFTLATDAQNKTLEGQNRDLAELKDAVEAMRDRVTAIDKSKASRSDLKAATRAPIRRTDGPSEPPPADPPPYRPKLPSRGRFGAE